MRTYRILSLDGGGIKGVFPASFLASLEEDLELPIGRYFDLIVGTSTGGIIAIGLGLGFSAKQLLEFYRTMGPNVFRGCRRSNWFRQVRTAKYDSKALKEALESKFGDAKIGNSFTRLVIPSLNLDTGEVHIYKTSHHPHLEKDYKRTAVEAAMATAAAPTYFPSYIASSGIPLVDGGVWANNPVGVAAVEAIAVLGWSKEALRVLSIGCTARPVDVGHGRHGNKGLLYWAVKAVEVFMAGQSSGSLGTAYVIAGHDNVFRINPAVPAGRYGLDATREINALQGLGDSEARKALPKLRSTFFQEPAEPFTAFHTVESADHEAGK